MKVIIFGAGRVGMNLLRLLEPSGFDITMVDKNRDKCDHVATDAKALIICRDCTEPEVLDELKLGTADYVFVITGEEETNFLVSIYAKNAGARHVIARCESMKHSIMMEKLGVESLVPEITLAQELSNRVLNPTIFKMLSPGESNLELFELRIPEIIKKKTVGEIFKEKDVSLLALFDGEKFILPKSGDYMNASKAVIVSTGGRKSLW